MCSINERGRRKTGSVVSDPPETRSFAGKWGQSENNESREQGEIKLFYGRDSLAPRGVGAVRYNRKVYFRGAAIHEAASHLLLLGSNNP